MKKILFLLIISLISYSQIIDTIIRFNDEPWELLYLPDKNKLYIDFGRNSYHLVLDCSTFEIKKIIRRPSGYYGSACGVYNPRRKKIYFGFNPHPESIAVIDAEKDTLIKLINFKSHSPWAICYNSKNDRIYVAAGSGIGVIDCETDSLIKIITHPQYYLSKFTFWDSFGNKVYCGSAWATVVGVIDCETDSLIKIIENVASGPHHAGYSSLQRKLYVSTTWRNYLGIICTKRDTLIRRYNNLGVDWDIRIIYNEKEDKIYLPSDDSISYVIKVIDCETDSVIKEIRAGELCNMYLCEWSNRLYFVSCVFDEKKKSSYNILYIVDCSNDSIISQLRFGRCAWDRYGMTGNPYTRQIYISDQHDSSLYVIRDTIFLSLKEDNFKEEKIKTFPNIVKSFLNISFLKRPCEIEIYNILGKLIKKFEITKNTENKISLKNIRKGVYIIKIGDKRKKNYLIKLTNLLFRCP